MGLEPGPIWWQAVTLTDRLTGLELWTRKMEGNQMSCNFSLFLFISSNRKKREDGLNARG